jgi:hypothetical protein
MQEKVAAKKQTAEHPTYITKSTNINQIVSVSFSRNHFTQYEGDVLIQQNSMTIEKVIHILYISYVQ